MEERSRLQPPWLQRKSTGTASTLQSYQGDSTLAASGGGINVNAATAPSDVGSVHTSTSLLGRYHHFPKAQILMNETDCGGGGVNATAASAASGASIISSVNHYESSHLHATLGPALASLPPPPPPRGCLNQKNNQASTTSAWRKLLSSVFQSGATNTTARGGHNAATTAASAIRPRPLTLGHYHHHRLNAENTLRLEAHRQLFQFSDYHMHHQDNDQQMRPSSQSQRGPHQQQPLHPQPTQPSARGHFCSNDSSLQYYASVGFRSLLLYIA